MPQMSPADYDNCECEVSNKTSNKLGKGWYWLSGLVYYVLDSTIEKVTGLLLLKLRICQGKD